MDLRCKSLAVLTVLMLGIVSTSPRACWAVPQESEATRSASPNETASPPAASPSRTAIDSEGRIVQFQRDIAPILRAHCLECHGPDEAKNDLRVDDGELLLQYIEPEDIESSTLYVDYLTTDDEDMLMPPTSHGGPLQPSELALIRTWIGEGADWPEDAVVAVGVADAVEPPIGPRSRSLPQRIWAFQGYFHPATIHFPVALLMVGALFVVLGIKWPEIGTQIPLACLLLGGISAVIATMMGWSFASEQGYGNWDRIDFDSEVFWHRWSGMVVALGSIVLIVVAMVGWWRESDSLRKLWKVGLLVLAAMVGAVGHQGGELSYGKDFYPKAVRILMGTESEGQTPVAGIAKPLDNPQQP
ncbi:c-type cytochrome domain-containing protein [Novipirellula artificiosorum]|uniref:Planctomycete cytochrome C n=1 Tax=Novipirellula artificiosorum TaxID=2528016 RepID=A0A5C6E0C7_9BACT|nr:c-type cytochrome domain-containing protein [Novipirellula artificiosorum]TWU42175.1 Planctomycete cytochrome C [Novipirellula artificiosorum]